MYELPIHTWDGFISDTLHDRPPGAQHLTYYINEDYSPPAIERLYLVDNEHATVADLLWPRDIPGLVFPDATLGFVNEYGETMEWITVHPDFCADCGCPITPENDSGWETFVSARETQPQCQDCWEKSCRIGSKGTGPGVSGITESGQCFLKPYGSWQIDERTDLLIYIIRDEFDDDIWE